MALFAFLPAMLAWQNGLVAPAQARMRQEPVRIETAAGKTLSLDVEVARTDQEKALGLMYRTELADTQGMLFPYGPEQLITMWMHNTYIPLDMLFLNAQGTVVRIEAKAEPLSDRIISSEVMAAAVLELAGGAAERLGIKPGDRVRHPLLEGGSR